MDFEQIVLSLTNEFAEFRGEIKEFRKQFSDWKISLEETNKTLNALLIREADRGGELRGFKRSTILLATIISLTISALGVAAAYVR